MIGGELTVVGGAGGGLLGPAVYEVVVYGRERGGDCEEEGEKDAERDLNFHWKGFRFGGLKRLKSVVYGGGEEEVRSVWGF